MRSRLNVSASYNPPRASFLHEFKLPVDSRQAFFLPNLPFPTWPGQESEEKSRFSNGYSNGCPANEFDLEMAILCITIEFDVCID